MTTTAVFAEIIVVGLEAEAWIVLLVLAIWGTEWVDLDALDGWSALVTILIVATAYALGIVVDRFADSSVKAVAECVRALRSKPKRRGVPFKRKRIYVLQEGAEPLTKFLEYQRSRQRVARGTIINLVFAIPSVLAFLHWRADVSSSWLVGVTIVGILLIAASVYANERIRAAQERNLDIAYDLLREQP